MYILKNSWLYRIFMALWQAVPASGCAKFGRSCAALWQKSAAYRVLDRFLSEPDRSGRSLYARAMKSFGRAAERLMACLGRLWQKSLVGRWSAGLYRTAKKSLSCGLFVSLGFRKLAVFALAMYVLIDYVLREKIGIGILASGWDEGLFILLFAYVAAQRGLHPQRFGGRVTALEGLVLLFAAGGFFLMCAVCPNPSVAFDGYRAVVQYVLWFFVFIRLLGDRDDFYLFYYALLGLAVLMCLHGVYQYVVATPIPASWVSQTEMGVRTRVFSITGSPNIFGSFIVMTAPLAAGLIYAWKDLRAKLVAWFALGVMCLAVLFTFSRGAWVGAVVAVVLFALLVDRRLIALLAAGLAGALVFIPSIASRITYLFTSDFVEASMAGGRMIRWQTGMDLLSSASEWLGFGLGRFGGAVAMQNQIIEETEEFEYFYLDNYYLKTLVEMGYIGLALFVLLLAGLVIWGLRGVWRLRGDRDYPMVCGILAGLAGVMAHCGFENIFEVPYMTAYFWLLAALLLYRCYFVKGSSAKRPPIPEPPKQRT